MYLSSYYCIFYSGDSSSWMVRWWETGPITAYHYKTEAQLRLLGFFIFVFFVTSIER